MNKKILLLAVVVSIFVVGMVCAFAAEPVHAAQYKHKKSITVKVKDGKKTIKVKCNYKKAYKQYLGTKKAHGKKYSVYVCYEHKNGMQNGKKGWWTGAMNGSISKSTKNIVKYNKKHPVTTIKL